jgi:hypothetical protein
MDTVKSVILSPATPPVVRNRLMDILAAATYRFYGPDKDGFQLTWRQVRPLNKPEDGIPFDMQDSMFDPTQGHRWRALTSPAPRVAHVNAPHSPQVHQPDSKRQDLDHGRKGRQQGRGDHELPKPPHKVDRRFILSDEDMRRLYEERDVAVHNSCILNEALLCSTPETFHSDPFIKV